MRPIGTMTSIDMETNPSCSWDTQTTNYFVINFLKLEIVMECKTD